MGKCNTQANDMARMANNWQTPGASNPGCYNRHDEESLNGREVKIHILDNDIWTLEVFRGYRVHIGTPEGVPGIPPAITWA